MPGVVAVGDRHPAYYDDVTWEVYRRGRKLGLDVRILPAISCLDSMAANCDLERVVGDRWLAAGDACVSFDPLSSQGILTALYSGLKAGRALDSDLKGDSEALSRYADNIDAVFDAYLKNHSV